jgi:hypothetical protein
MIRNKKVGKRSPSPKPSPHGEGFHGFRFVRNSRAGYDGRTTIRRRSEDGCTLSSGERERVRASQKLTSSGEREKRFQRWLRRRPIGTAAKGSVIVIKKPLKKFLI